MLNHHEFEGQCEQQEREKPSAPAPSIANPAAASSRPSEFTEVTAGTEACCATDAVTRQELPPLARRIPNTAFGISMGLGGNALIWTNLLATDLISAHAGKVLQILFWTLTLTSGIVVSICFLLKCHYHADIVREEWHHPARVHFFHGPHLILIMLTLAAPFDMSRAALQTLWAIAATAQTVLALSIYERWMFDPQSELSSGKPQFFLSTVGWFFLLILGIKAEIDVVWGVDLPAMCLGPGVVFYLIVMISNFQSIHKDPAGKAQPALFLFIAPPSLGCVGIALYEGEFGLVPRAIFGYSLVMLMLFARIGPTILQDPVVLGVYWAYIFPLAALSSASVMYAQDEGTLGAKILCYILVSIAVAALAIVLVRMTWHTIVVMKGRAVWGDPIVNNMAQTGSAIAPFGAGYDTKAELLPSELQGSRH